MPQGGLEALETKDPLDIMAFQYDIVCNGVELSSGAIRNHLPDVMYKAFAIAGYTQEQVDEQFAGMISALKFGAPPHGGSALGIDRIVLLLADPPNLREVGADARRVGKEGRVTCRSRGSALYEKKKKKNNIPRQDNR